MTLPFPPGSGQRAFGTQREEGEMGKYVVFHDKRLRGSAPQRRSVTNLSLDGSTSLFGTFPIIRALVQLDGRQAMYVLCHGYAGVSTSQQVCGDMGGMGLQLGREGVLHSNVSRWQELSGSLTSMTAAQLLTVSI
jgi:hypothetical protein